MNVKAKTGLASQSSNTSSYLLLRDHHCYFHHQLEYSILINEVQRQGRIASFHSWEHVPGHSMPSSNHSLAHYLQVHRLVLPNWYNNPKIVMLHLNCGDNEWCRLTKKIRVWRLLMQKHFSRESGYLILLWATAGTVCALCFVPNSFFVESVVACIFMLLMTMSYYFGKEEATLKNKRKQHKWDKRYMYYIMIQIYNLIYFIPKWANISLLHSSIQS